MSTEQEGPEAVRRATDACLRLLAVRARSRHELKLATERRGLLGRPLGPKERARAGRLLHSRGFSEDVIQRLLGEPSLDPSGLDD